MALCHIGLVKDHGGHFLWYLVLFAAIFLPALVRFSRTKQPSPVKLFCVGLWLFFACYPSIDQFHGIVAMPGENSLRKIAKRNYIVLLGGSVQREYELLTFCYLSVVFVLYAVCFLLTALSGGAMTVVVRSSNKAYYILLLNK